MHDRKQSPATTRPADPDAAAPTPPPWTCRLRAVACLARTGGRLGGFAVVAYSATPVGPYREALVGQLDGLLGGLLDGLLGGLLGGSPGRLLRGSVPWIVVDSEASALAAREHWALPKQLAALRFAEALDEAHVDGGGAQLEVRARAAGPRLPVVVPAALAQPGSAPAPVRFTGRARPAVVRLSGDLPCGLRPGARPGALLEGTLRLGAPGVRGRSPG